LVSDINSKVENVKPYLFSSNFLLTEIQNFEQIKQLEITNLLLLILKDVQIRQKLEMNNEGIVWHFTRWRPTIFSEYSYIRYQFISANIFTKYILEEGSEELNNYINDNFKIDYNYLNSYGINRTEVKSVLIKLGAKESFNDIPPDNIYKIIKSIPAKDVTKKGKATQTIYKLALDSLDKQKSSILIPVDLEFFARKGLEEGYFSRDSIYYSDNTILPKKILDKIYILNLPKRSGEDKVETYFGVKSLRVFKIEIVKSSIVYSVLNADFEKLFETIKPYILTYRLSKLKVDTSKRNEEAAKLKQCNINIVQQSFYNFGNDKNISLEEDELININNQFYYKSTNSISINELKQNYKFCEAFAEMMCIIFKANELKNEFLQILKYDTSFTHQLVTSDFGKESLEESYRLLGVSRKEISFWSNVFKLKGKQLEENIPNDNILKQIIQKDISYELPINYDEVNFDNFCNKQSYDFIRELTLHLNLNVNEIIPSGIYCWHKEKFNEAMKDNKYKFNLLLWSKLLAAKDEQSQYISLLYLYNNDLIGYVENEIQSLKYSVNVDYENLISTWVVKYFSVNLSESLSKPPDIKNLYEELLHQYNVTENDISDEKIRSLLYFMGNNELIDEYLKKHHSTNADNDDGGTVKPPTIKGVIVDVSLSKNEKIISFNSHSNGKKGWLYSGTSEKTRTLSGKRAELLVYNTWIDQFGIENVKWVSGYSDTPDKNDKLHYDIEYKDSEGQWKFLEVKAISDDYFIITNQEKDKGLSEPDKYEMALVKEEYIYLVKDLFKFELGESFNNNLKFVPVVKDYVFSFNIRKLLDK